MIDEKELKAYIDGLHNEHHGGKGDWHFRLALRKVLYFMDSMQKESVDYTKLNTMLDDAMSKETKESWDERLGEDPVTKGLETVNDDLEAEYDRYILADNGEHEWGREEYLAFARHFAEWQKKKDEKIHAQKNEEYTEGVKGKYTTVTK